MPCPAVEKILVHEALLGARLDALLSALRQAGVTLHGGPRAVSELGLPPAPAPRHEYGTLDLSVELVGGVREAIEHIHANGSGHTECVITEDEGVAAHFMRSVDSACVFHNASTRFAGGCRAGCLHIVCLVMFFRGGCRLSTHRRTCLQARKGKGMSKGSNHLFIVMPLLALVTYSPPPNPSPTSHADGYRFGLGAEVGISTSRIHARGPVGVEGLLTTRFLLRGHGQVVDHDAGVTYTHKALPIS
jgi:gamma-glutamyl phosphate reductase